MSFLKELQQKLPITLSNEEFKDFQVLFDNTETLESLGTKENQGIFKRVENKYGLEDWKTLKYTLNGEEVTMPEGVLKFKEWTEDPKNLITDVSERAGSVIFNPALNGNTLKSIIGDTYKGMDCKYMVPITYHRTTVTKRSGNAYIDYYVYILGVIYLGEGKNYGKVGFFTHNNNLSAEKIWNSYKMTEYWGILKWFQPSFNIHADDLIKAYTPLIIRIGQFIGKMAGKVKDLFKSKEKESE